MLSELLKKIKSNKNIVYYVIIAVIVYFIYVYFTQCIPKFIKKFFNNRNTAVRYVRRTYEQDKNASLNFW